MLLADPHECVRQGVKEVLRTHDDLCVLGEACDGRAVLSLTSVLNPGIVIIEANLPGLGGPRVVAELCNRYDRKVLVLTACESPDAVRLFLAVGAQGYVLKSSSVEHIVHAVRVVAGGGTYIDPVIAAAVVNCPSCAPIAQPDRELTGREVQVLRGIAQGFSNKEIAAHFRLSVKSVETYKTRAMRKLHIRTRVAIIQYAAHAGWTTETLLA